MINYGPDSTPTIGRFWNAEDDSVIVPGRLDLSDTWPRVELIGELTSMWEEVSANASGAHSFGFRNSSDESIVIHGQLAGLAGPVTIIDARVRRHSGDEQIWQGAYALLGAHVKTQDDIFAKAQLRFDFLDYWANFSGLSFSCNSSLTEADIEYRHPETLDAPMVGRDGLIALQAGWEMPQPDLTGVRLTTLAWLSVRDASGFTVEELLRRYITPIQTLMMLCYGESTPLIKARLTAAGVEKYVELVSPAVHAPSGKHPDEPLLSLKEIGLGGMAFWLSCFQDFSPLPQIVASATASAEGSIENQVLQLCTAAEGLHRRLYPSDRRLASEDVAQAREALLDSTLTAEARDILDSALVTYLWDASYPQRLRRLIADVRPVLPDAAGRVSRWVAAVVNARIGFAHQLSGSTQTTPVSEYLALRDSLRWILTARLLMTLDLSSGQLADALARYQPYRNLHHYAPSWLPKVYG